MNIKEVIHETRGVVNKNKSVFFSFYIAIAIVFFAFAVGFALLDVNYSFFVVLAGFIVLLPLFIGVDYIAKKAVSAEELEYRDFYLGHKNFLTSMTLETKVISRGLIFMFLGFYVGNVIFNGMLLMYIGNKNPEIMSLMYDVVAQKATIDELITVLSTISYLETASIITTCLSFVVGGLFYIWQGKRYTFLPFICFETRFNLNTAVYLSKQSSESIKKNFFKYNLMYLGLVIVGAVAGVGAYNLMVLFANPIISMVVAIGVGSLLLAPLYLEYKVSMYVIYAKYFKVGIDATFKQKLEEAQKKMDI